MIGIYQIINKVNGKTYIGQSTDIDRRWSEHKRSKDDYAIHKAIRKYGVKNFEIIILRECDVSQLDELEMFYIQQYQTIIPYGYNMTYGGNRTIVKYGENNPNAVLNEDIVYQIREMYKTNITKSQAYELCEGIISLNTFADVWNGKTWKHVHYDVYTKENKEKHKKQKNRRHSYKINPKDVLFIRDCKNKGMLKSDVFDKYYPDLNKNTFSDVWYGKTYKEIYKQICNDYS